MLPDAISVNDACGKRREDRATGLPSRTVQVWHRWSGKLLPGGIFPGWLGFARYQHARAIGFVTKS
jgi:hypothetical protein